MRETTAGFPSKRVWQQHNWPEYTQREGSRPFGMAGSGLEMTIPHLPPPSASHTRTYNRTPSFSIEAGKDVVFICFLL